MAHTTTTTLQDYGRGSDRHGNIPYYYVFPYRFYVKENQLMPDDMVTWCRENCEGYYKIVTYTHNTSKRITGSKKFDSKVVFVDKVYLSRDSDAMMLRLSYSVSDVVIRRPDKLRKEDAYE